MTWIASSTIGRSRRGPRVVAERGWRWCRRNPVMATLTASVSVLLVVAVVVATWLGRERATALSLLHRAEDAERQRTEQLWQSALARARAERSSGRVGQRLASLEAIQEAVALAHELGSPPPPTTRCATRRSPAWRSSTSARWSRWTYRPAPLPPGPRHL